MQEYRMDPAPPPPVPPVDVIAYADPAVRRRAPLWWRLAFTLACVYLPYAWLVLGGGSWHDYRLTWIKMWPILPGLTAGLLVIPRGSNAVEFAAMGATAGVVVGVFLLLAARSRRRVPIPTIVALVLSVLNSWIAYAIYRA
jgi:hypothetical protein